MSPVRIGARWEDLVQTDLINCLNRDTSAYAAELGLSLRKHMTRDECQALLFGTGYLDFRSVRELKNFAKRHLAHYSPYAERTYYRLLRRQYHFRRMRAPAEFLLATDYRTGNMRIIDFIKAFLRAEEAMWKAVSRF